MKLQQCIAAVIILITVVFSLKAQQNSDSISARTKKKYQAKAPPTQPFRKEAFTKTNNTTVRWLGMAGFLINSRGTTLMVDPLLKDSTCP
jgi:hypothetical protein